MQGGNLVGVPELTGHARRVSRDFHKLWAMLSFWSWQLATLEEQDTERQGEILIALDYLQRDVRNLSDELARKDVPRELGLETVDRHRRVLNPAGLLWLDFYEQTLRAERAWKAKSDALILESETLEREKRLEEFSESIRQYDNWLAEKLKETHTEIELGGQEEEAFEEDAPEMSDDEIMERSLSPNLSVMLEGIGALIKDENSDEDPRMQQVYDAFKPYGTGKELPAGTTPQIVRFLVVSAIVPGLWHRLDELDPRLADALILTYADGLGMTKLAKRLPDVNNAAMAGYLVRRGLKKLYDWFPEPDDDWPFDKTVEFPLDELLASRRDRLRAAGEKRGEVNKTSEWGRNTVARRWWPNQESGGRKR